MTGEIRKQRLPAGEYALPVFSPEESLSGRPGQREAAAAAVMNGFYDALAREAETYVQSLRKEGRRARYLAEATVREDKGRFCVTCLLRLREYGRTTAEKTLIHVWKDGILLRSR